MGGVVDLQKTPDAVFIVDVNTEATAVTEAARLGMPVIALVDSNSDPDRVDYVIAGNDDAIRAADLIAGAIADAALEGRRMAGAKASKGDSPDDESADFEPTVDESIPDFEQEPAPAPVTADTGAEPATETANG